MLESLKKTLIIWLGGLPDIDSAIERIKNTADADHKARILADAVKKLYNAVGADDILRQEKDGSWIFQGKPLTGIEVSQLREEAAFMLSMRLWRVIKWDIRYQLGKKMFEEARVKEDIVWGQLLTYLDDIIRTRLQKMK